MNANLGCHPERSEGPLHFSCASRMHGSFASIRMTNPIFYSLLDRFDHQFLAPSSPFRQLDQHNRYQHQNDSNGLQGPQ